MGKIIDKVLRGVYGNDTLFDLLQGKHWPTGDETDKYLISKERVRRRDERIKVKYQVKHQVDSLESTKKLETETTQIQPTPEQTLTTNQIGLDWTNYSLKDRKYSETSLGLEWPSYQI